MHFPKTLTLLYFYNRGHRLIVQLPGMRKRKRTSHVLLKAKGELQMERRKRQQLQREVWHLRKRFKSSTPTENTVSGPPMQQEATNTPEPKLLADSSLHLAEAFFCVKLADLKYFNKLFMLKVISFVVFL